MAKTGLVYIGIFGEVVALDRVTGEEVWRTNLKGADFVTVVLDGGDLFAATKGELFCLDPATGKERWRNRLKRLGRGLVSISPGSGQQVVSASEKQRRDQDAAPRLRYD
jgi:outer membrane protein assembly factor BamB